MNNNGAMGGTSGFLGGEVWMWLIGVLVVVLLVVLIMKVAKK